MEYINIITSIVAVLLGVILYIKNVTYAYWKKRGVPYIEPDLFFGNTKKSIKGELHSGEDFRNMYREFKRRGLKHGGVYTLMTPIYLPTDPELVKCILQKDFDHFVNRGMYVNEKVDPLSGHLFNLENTKWKNLRTKLTPTFTSGKMKMMFQTLVACSDELDKLLENHSVFQDAVDIKDILARFTTDIIGSCAFGIDCNSLKDPESKFRVVGRTLFESSSVKAFKQLIRIVIPHCLLKFIRFRTVSKEYEDFFINIVKNTVEYRQKNNISRKDFMQLLLELKNKGDVSEDDKVPAVKEKNGQQGNFLSTNEIAAQCFVFFLAGFETSSTTMTFALYELARNQGIQDKLREEIKSTLRKHNNKLTYESIMEMTYLDKVVHETLRLHSPVLLMQRVCNKAYKVPDTNVILEPGTRVIIPIYALQTDPEYYPNPEVFDPERFSEENKAKRPSTTYMPFGEGPRICIGLRFGLLQSKVGLLKILENYRVTLDKKTKPHLELDPRAIVATAKDGVWLNISKVK